MKAIAETILNHLDTCPIPSSNSKWRYAYELVLGAAVSLISAEKYFVGTSHYHQKEPYDYLLSALPKLVRKAHQEAADKPIDLYHEGLEIWTAGYFFNSGVIRIACAYEYAIHTACGDDPYDNLDFKEASIYLRSIKQEFPPEIVNHLAAFESVTGRDKLHQQVDQLVGRLVAEGCPDDEKFYEWLQKNDDEFFRTAFYYVWCDYNWFKHRPMGYPAGNHPRKAHHVQFALAARAYCALCDFYSWCYRLP
ncbi:MAG: hypothetical protein NDI90_06570 [Nitrospira sp. BO4]|jgi:hypothetical protein|nr:hypothetical protein [Nitrospira sp. BO4]